MKIENSISLMDSERFFNMIRDVLKNIIIFKINETH